MQLNSDTAKAIAEAVHAAWNKRNIEAMLDNYAEDLIYWSNAGGPDDSPIRVTGKSGLRELLTPILAAVDCATSIETFSFVKGVARVQVSTYVKHRLTGLDLCGNYRQILHFRDFRIWKNEEFHDVALLSTFWRLVARESQLKQPSLRGSN